ncbi:hypothetical protein ABH935_005038 [Catenulispora sp. GAS73]
MDSGVMVDFMQRLDADDASKRAADVGSLNRRWWLQKVGSPGDPRSYEGKWWVVFF